MPLTWLFNFARHFNLNCSSTSGGKHVAGSYHYAHRAMDLYGPDAEMKRCMRAALARHREFREAFHDPMGRYVKNGEVRLGEIGGHMDHVHLAR